MSPSDPATSTPDQINYDSSKYTKKKKLGVNFAARKALRDEELKREERGEVVEIAEREDVDRGLVLVLISFLSSRS